MTTVRQCLKNVVFPGYSSARNKLTSKTKTKGPGGSAVKKKKVELAINEAIKKIESPRDERKVIETLILVYACQIHCSLTTSLSIMELILLSRCIFLSKFREFGVRALGGSKHVNWPK